MLTIRTETQGAYDPSTGTTAAGTTTDRTAKIALVSYKESDIDGTKVKFGDRKALISALDSNGQAIAYPPLVDDRIIGEGDAVTIVSLRILKINGTEVAWIAQVRE